MIVNNIAIYEIEKNDHIFQVHTVILLKTSQQQF